MLGDNFLPADIAPRHGGGRGMAGWDDAIPYLDRLRDAYNYPPPSAASPVDALYAEYLRQRQRFGSAPSFFFDTAAELFDGRGSSPSPEAVVLGTRVLTAVCDLLPADANALRVVRPPLSGGMVGVSFVGWDGCSFLSWVEMLLAMMHRRQRMLLVDCSGRS